MATPPLSILRLTGASLSAGAGLGKGDSGSHAIVCEGIGEKSLLGESGEGSIATILVPLRHQCALQQDGIPEQARGVDYCLRWTWRNLLISSSVFSGLGTPALLSFGSSFLNREEVRDSQYFFHRNAHSLKKKSPVSSCRASN
jgi:hypothetical protein